jgi:hypothetical protein
MTVGDILSGIVRFLANSFFDMQGGMKIINKSLRDRK